MDLDFQLVWDLFLINKWNKKKYRSNIINSITSISFLSNTKEKGICLNS